MNTQALFVAVIVLSVLMIFSILTMASLFYSANFPEFRLVSPEKQREIVQGAADVSRRLTEAGVWHTATCGTLLGANRNGGVINWDDDVDFAILQTDHDKVKALFSAKCTFFGLQAPLPHVDFFELQPKDGKYVYIYQKEARMTFANGWLDKEYMLAEEVEGPIVDVPFSTAGLSLTVKAIANPNRFLETCYGRKWATQAVVRPTHDDKPKITELLRPGFRLYTEVLGSMIKKK